MACAESLTDESTRSGDGQKRNSMSQSVSTHRTVSNEKPYELLTYDDIPEWYQDNRHIRGGYRPVSNSTQACLHSWFHLHNESVNIYSHLVPAVLFLFGVLYVLEPLHLRYENVAAGDYAVVAFFLLSATACFSLSAFYHTFISHSQKVEAQWLKLDFLGIILLIMGSFFANVYVTFWCEEKQQNIYWGMIGGLGAVSMIIICSPYFQGLRWRTFRLLTFVCTGLSGIAPMAHGLEMFGFSKMVHQAGLPFFLAAGSLFLVSCVIYGTRFPEQFWPGVFDIFGSSHQIFHSVVVIATVVHLAGVMSALDYNLRNRQCAVS